MHGEGDKLFVHPPSCCENLLLLIDSSAEFYRVDVAVENRSITNVVFDPGDKRLEELFVRRAAAVLYLKGAGMRGGIRASIYNGVSEGAVQSLGDFMRIWFMHGEGDKLFVHPPSSCMGSRGWPRRSLLPFDIMMSLHPLYQGDEKGMILMRMEGAPQFRVFFGS